MVSQERARAGAVDLGLPILIPEYHISRLKSLRPSQSLTLLFLILELKEINLSPCTLFQTTLYSIIIMSRCSTPRPTDKSALKAETKTRSVSPQYNNHSLTLHSVITPSESIRGDLDALSKATLAQAGPILLRLLQSTEFRDYAYNQGGLSAGKRDESETLARSRPSTSWPSPKSSIRLSVVFDDHTIHGDEKNMMNYVRDLAIAESIVRVGELEEDLESEEEESETDDEMDRWVSLQSRMASVSNTL